jgi:hypothetical protein
MEQSEFCKIKYRNIDNSEFQSRGMPAFWLFKAEELHRAANILLESHICDSMNFNKALMAWAEKQTTKAPTMSINLTFPCFLLMGYSLENLLKGIIVSSDPECLSQGKLPKKINDHKLLNLAKTANIRFSDDEDILCKLIQSAVISFGRYPISKKAIDGMTEEISIDYVKSGLVFNTLYDRLKKLIPFDLRWKKKPPN